MNEELINKIITYNYNNFGNEFGDALVDLQKENARLKDKIEKTIEHIKELDDNTDDTTCYDIDKYVKEDLLNILKEN